MESVLSIKQLKKQMAAAILSVCVAAIALSSSTYAWFISNKNVNGTTSSISATADGVVLQINAGDVADHDGDSATVAATKGHAITPASSENMIDWYVPESWTANLAKVGTYQKVTLEADKNGKKDGTYLLGGKAYYAYVLSEFTLFAVKNTGHADVYFDGAAANGAIEVTRSDAEGNVTDKVAASMRVGIVINDRTHGDQLIAVFAPTEPIGAENDVNYNSTDATTGWRVVSGTGAVSNTTKKADYTHISGTDDQKWTLRKENGTYVVPTAEQIKVASDVDWNGVIMKVYIWMEGTDSDCIASVVDGDEAEYDVTVHLVGLSS